MKPEICFFPDAADVARHAAAEFARAFDDSLRSNETFRVLLSGGRTPKTLFHLLAGAEYRELPWPEAEFFWGDERYVPYTHSESNYRAANDILFKNVPVAGDRIYPMPTDSNDPARDAERYEKSLRGVFAAETGGDPRFDFALLGVGGDGHTASLFPGGEAVKERDKWVVPAYNAGAEIASRLTLTLPAINASEKIVFMICGEEKRPVVKKMLESFDSGVPAPDTPATFVRPMRGNLSLFIDRAAAGDNWII